MTELAALLVLSSLICSAVAIGDVHTSVAAVSRLAMAEETVVAVLTEYLATQDRRNDVIRRYVESWPGAPRGHTTNPVSSYHLLRRLTEDYDAVLAALEGDAALDDVKKNLTTAKEGLSLPQESDLNGAAFSLVRLQSTYGLDLEDLVQGRVLDAPAAAHLTAEDCLRFGHQSFVNLEFDLSERWTRKGLELWLQSGVHSRAQQRRVDEVERTLLKRSAMRSLVEQLAKDTPEEVLDQFSGMGIPGSFQKTMYSLRDGHEHVDVMADNYQRLCRGEALRPTEYTSTFHCGYVFRNVKFGALMPFKAELLWADPIIMMYHDVISDTEIEEVKTLTEPQLETTEVHSFVTHKKMKSLARIGKTAWVSAGSSPTMDKVLQRIEDMTGLATDTAEDLHVLNYGVGGHYDVHVDFFDLRNKSMDGRLDEGDRMATALFYLNDVGAGGSTVFPILGLEVPAKKGAALFWFNLKRSGQGDYRTAHASCPVLLGEKWIANLWLREAGQEFRWPCSTSSDE